MSQNNDDSPYDIHSQWNPFPSNYNPSPPPSTTTPMPGFGQAYQMSPQTQHYPQTQNFPPFQTQNYPQMTPEQYQEFMLWKQSQQPTSEQQSAETPTSSRKPKAAAKSKGKQPAQPGEAKKKKVITNRNIWTSDEELMLAQCWICISESPNRGNDQTSDSFWHLVVAEYNKRADMEAFVHRNKDALSSKWKYLNERCQKFNGIWERLARQPVSGEDAERFRLRVMDQYQLEKVAVFHHEKAWGFLRHQQKWLVPDPVVVGRRNKRRETIDLEAISVPLDDDEDNEEPNAALFAQDPIPRPPGKSRRPKSQKNVIRFGGVVSCFL